MPNIQIPSFDDFLRDMGEARMSEWVAEANQTLSHFNGRPLDALPTALLAASQKMTIAMMKDYHEWLIEALSQVSLRLVHK